MDKEAASCPAMADEQRPGDNMADGRTHEEVREKRKDKIRKRTLLEKEEKEATAASKARSRRRCPRRNYQGHGASRHRGSQVIVLRDHRC